MNLKHMILILPYYSIMQSPNNIIRWDQCPSDPNPCAPEPDSISNMGARIYSEEYYKGETIEFTIDNAWDCVDLPPFRIKSVLSNASTQLTFHYGVGCVGHVIQQVQGGFFNGTGVNGLCAGSVFIKFNRYGSC
ncbi:hypothetical protein CONCODRAFT_13803 [Conidiobolus coronatus NRRL 28638]|uniref:Uncharacterized protein n=1 Tax=Conidiobolus coronatus (strain ATCC 28846 / CBS 209.66 / NRRL 28638) TaxID=796925 RepID=A0A137NQ36_CONC2|nr:hypothetical protein CONCODRAFT_13803 [Conidiobolus coronatus NRRL 28638]|eukprot:KXN64851.1 hypothetical protein CONCODRAFT_13803 [Conidiobolus coronatus NRRL 28638]